MKPWKPLLALFCITLATSSATAAVPFKGLLYQSRGAAVVDVGTDGRLVVSNIGSSGQDGVSIDCLHMDGVRLVLDGECSAADNGASCALTYRCRLNGLPPGTPVLSSRVSFTVSSSLVDLVCAPSELSSSPTQTVTLTRGGVVVYSCVVPVATHVSVAMDALGSCPRPTLSCSVDRKVHGLHRGVELQRVMHVSVAGHDEDCDGIDFLSAIDPPDQDCDGDSSDLRVSSPPGSSFSSVLCPSGQCCALGHFVQGSGSSLLSVVADASGRRRLTASNIGSSGQDGVDVVRVPSLYSSGGGGAGGAAVALRFAPPSLYFDLATDNGASSAVSIHGVAFSSTGASLGPATASLTLTVTGSSFHAIPLHTGGGADQEWVAVISGGVEVARAMLAPGGGVVVTPPPGEPQGMAINEKGLPGSSCRPAPNGKTPFMVAQPTSIQPTSTQMKADLSRGHQPDLARVLRASFVNDRVFLFGGVQATGDELVCWTQSSAGPLAGTLEVEMTSSRVTCPNPASSLSSTTFLDLLASGGNPIGPDVSGSTSLSSTHTCVTVPFLYTRSDSTPVRAYSVAFHLSPELALCGSGVVEGDYLSRIAGTQLFVTNHGGGSYTVDCGILGPVCGATGDGSLFSLNLASTVQSAGTVGVITVDSVSVRDCSNAEVVADAGSPGDIQIVTTAPPALAGLDAVQVKTGNAPGGATTAIDARFPSVSFPGLSVDLYRKGFGNYPLYDNGASAGHVPTPPPTPAVALLSAWKLVSCSSGTCSSGSCASGTCVTSMLDSPPTRDLFYYVAFVRDLYGNISPVSNMTPGTLDYHLGDVSNGSAACAGDNQVDILDVSLLGAHYGASVAAGSSFACLDVGPTTDRSVDARPTTDSVLNFEDFMMFAINYGAVSAPSSASRPVASAVNTSHLVVPSLPAAGETFAVGVFVEGAGDVQGLSAQFAFDPAVVEQVGVDAGTLLAQQGRASTVLSSGPGNVDAALLGTGPGIAGSGEVARVTFRVKAAGDPGIALTNLIARDASNQPISVTGVNGVPSVPLRTALGFAYPNPFRESIALQLSLHASGPATIGVFDVAGRHVRALVQGTQPAGTRLVTWDGRDDSGLRLAPGAYIVRLEAAGLRESRTVQLVR